MNEYTTATNFQIKKLRGIDRRHWCEKFDIQHLELDDPSIR